MSRRVIPLALLWFAARSVACDHTENVGPGDHCYDEAPSLFGDTHYVCPMGYTCGDNDTCDPPQVSAPTPPRDAGEEDSGAPDLDAG